MKKNVSLLLILISTGLFNAQSFAEVNDRINKLSKKGNWESGIIEDNLTGKKFSLEKNDNILNSKKIIEFEPNNNITIIEMEEDKKNAKNISSIYSGDIMKNENVISVRADKLEGKKIAFPLVYNFILQKRNGILYLHNVNNGEKWEESVIVNQ